MNKVFVAISSPKIINTNVYGIDIPTKKELLCFQKTTETIEKDLQIEKLIFQDLSDLEGSIRSFKGFKNFEKSIIL